jgi:hypothetical protein
MQWLRADGPKVVGSNPTPATRQFNREAGHMLSLPFYFNSSYQIK